MNESAEAVRGRRCALLCVRAVPIIDPGSMIFTRPSQSVLRTTRSYCAARLSMNIFDLH